MFKILYLIIILKLLLLGQLVYSEKLGKKEYYKAESISIHYPSEHLVTMYALLNIYNNKKVRVDSTLAGRSLNSSQIH